MTRYADPERCPDCLSPMPYGSSRCPGCGLRLEGPLATELFSTLSHADELLTCLRSATAAVDAGRSTREPDTATSVHSAARGSARGQSDPGSLATLTPEPPSHPEPSVPTGGHRPRGGLSAASVPKVLLGLGALCLLVAALVFLAVTWSAMGVAGRTATLVGFTVVTGAVSAWAARRGLRAAAESLAVVALGLAAFDLFGARDAGWLGDVTTPGFLVVLGSVLAVTGGAAALAVRRTPASALVGAELIAAVGVATALAGGVAAERVPWSAGVTLAVFAAGAVTLAGHAVRLRVLSAGSTVVAATAWLFLATSAVERAGEHPTLRQLWIELEGWPLLVAAALAGGLSLVRGLPSAVRVTALGVAVLVLALAALAPFADETATARTLAGAVLLVALAGLTTLLPHPWRLGLAGAGAPGAVGLTVAGLGLAGEALGRLLWTGPVLGADGAGGSFAARPVPDWQLAGWLLPIVAVAVGAFLVAAAVALRSVDRAVAPLADVDVALGVVGATAALTLALHAVPVWLVLAVLLLAGGGFVVRWLHRQHALPLAGAGVFLVVALQLSLHAQWLTLATTVTGLAAAAVVYLRAAHLTVAVAAGGVVAAAVGGLVWTVGAIVDAPASWVALVALLVLAALVLGGPAADGRVRADGPAGVLRLGAEVGALVTAAVLTVAGVMSAASGSASTWFAVYLTVVGAVVSTVALLRSDRHGAGWLGGALLAAASWVRLADLGVETPEAYTVPSAVVLLAVGLYHLRRNPGTGTMTALSPGLGLALVPSLIWVLAEPIGVRSALLGVVCLALVVGGARLRWSAPLLHGAAVGAVVALRHAAPVAAEAVPRWALLGGAGLLLLAMGITWEARAREARRAVGYVRSLR